MNSGSTAAGNADTAAMANVVVAPNLVKATAKARGARIAPTWKVAVLAVTACNRWVLGTMLAVMAERAGCPKTLDIPRIAVTA